MASNDVLPSLAQDMIRIHKVITRGLTIGVERGEAYARDGFPNPGLRKGYTDYIHSLRVVLEAHHRGEDQIAFPILQGKQVTAPYETLTADHQRIEPLLGMVAKAESQLAGGTNDAVLSELVGLLRQLTSVWGPHIQVEEVHFTRPLLSNVMSPEEQAEVSGKMSQHAQQHATPPFLSLPFVLYNLQTEDRAAMAAVLPRTVVEELIPKVWKEQWSAMKPFLLE